MTSGTDRLLPALALCLAACSSPAATDLALLRGPTSVVSFLGKTHVKPGQVVPYLALVSSRGDELRLIDPSDDLVVRAPGFAYGLSIPTLPRQLRVAAGPVSDGGPDALVVSGSGAVVELVSTWEDGTDEARAAGSRVVATWDFRAEVGAGAEILSILGVPVPGAPFGSPPVAPAVPGRARILMGFSGSSDGTGGKLLALELVRQADGSLPTAKPAAVAHPLGFDPVALALSPDNFHVYCASPDIITDSVGRSVLGVAEVDTSPGLLAPWPVRSLDARAPTTLVAAAYLGERLADDPDSFGEPALRVFAALDASGCGPGHLVSCGIATLDPASGGLARDPAADQPAGSVPAQSYRTPMPVPGLPQALAVALPPLAGSQWKLSAGAVVQPLMLLAPGSGQRSTTAAAVAPSSAGPAFLFDLGRFSPPGELSLLRTDTRVRVTSAASLFVVGTTPDEPVLGLWHRDPGSPNPNRTADLLRSAIGVTPGFTVTDEWGIVAEGALPGLIARRSVIGRSGAGSYYLAVQETGGGVPLSWLRLDDPRLGIHLEDIAVVALDPNPCPHEPDVAAGEVVSPDARIQDILPPDPSLYPGGALLLASSAMPSCLADALDSQLSAQPPTLSAATTVRASGLILSGAATGYAGRPQLATTQDDAPYALQWAEEEPLLARCPFLQPGSPQPPPFCDAACRESCERLVLARKGRRVFYPGAENCAERPGVQPCEVRDVDGNLITKPLVPGPVLAFRAGVTSGSGGPVAGRPKRDSTILFNTQSGLIQWSRQPSTLSLPTSAIALDKSRFPDGGDLGTVFYVTYFGDALCEIPPGQSPAQVKTIR